MWLGLRSVSRLGTSGGLVLIKSVLGFIVISRLDPQIDSGKNKETFFTLTLDREIGEKGAAMVDLEQDSGPKKLGRVGP